MKRFNVAVDDDLYKALKNHLKEKDENISQWIRRQIKKELKIK